MESGTHICAPLLSITQQAWNRPLFIEESHDLGTRNQDEKPMTATGSQLFYRVALLSRALSTCLEAAPGSTVVLVAQSSTAVMEVMLAVLDAGCVLCPVNWRWTAIELAQALARLSPSLVLFDVQCMELVRSAVAMSQAPTERLETDPNTSQQLQAPHWNLCLVDHWSTELLASPSSSPLFAWRHTSQLLSGACTPPRGPPFKSPKQSLASPASLSPAQLDALKAVDLVFQSSAPLPAPPQQQLQLRTSPCGTALLVFTSGTTAAPKAVRLSHVAVHSQSLVKLALVGYCPRDTYMHTAPLFHIGGLSSAFAALMAGCTQVFLPRFEPATTLRTIVRHSVTVFIAVPTMLQDLAAAAAAAVASATASETTCASMAAGVVSRVPGMTVGSGADSGTSAVRTLRCVRRILVGAGGTSPALQDAVGRTFPCAELISAYGMTEACSSMTFRHLRGPVAATTSSSSPSSTSAPTTLTPSAAQMWNPPGSTSSVITRSAQGVSNPEGTARGAAAGADGAVCVGWPGPGVQILIRPSEELLSKRGKEAAATTVPRLVAAERQCAHAGGCKPYVVGEVLTRGPHVMLGYWHDPVATAEALCTNGWLRTGDLGYLAADGALWLMGRAKDMIKSGGENVFAPQVEAVLSSHSAVAGVAVVGLPDERLGELVAAVLVLRDGWTFEGPLMLHYPLPPAPPTLPLPLLSTTAQGGLSPYPKSQNVGSHAAEAVMFSNEGVGTATLGSIPAPRPHRISLASLQTHCRAQGLSGFQLPRFAAAQVQPLPTTSSGKVHKAMIREQLAALHSVVVAGARIPSRGAVDSGVVAISRL